MYVVESIFVKLLAIFVLVVIALAIGVVSRGVECPTIVETVVYDELVVDLSVVIFLVIIERVRAIGVNDLTFCIVATVTPLHLFRYTFIGQTYTCITSN